MSCDTKFPASWANERGVRVPANLLHARAAAAALETAAILVACIITCSSAVRPLKAVARS
jgi:hypothetical protein